MSESDRAWVRERAAAVPDGELRERYAKLLEAACEVGKLASGECSKWHGKPAAELAPFGRILDLIYDACGFDFEVKT